MWGFIVFSIAWNSLFSRHTQIFFDVEFIMCLHVKGVMTLLSHQVKEENFFPTSKLNIYQYWFEHNRKVEWLQYISCVFWLIIKNGHIACNQWRIILSIFQRKEWNCTFWLFITWLTRTHSLSVSSSVTELDYCSARNVKIQSIPSN